MLGGGLLFPLLVFLLLLFLLRASWNENRLNHEKTPEEGNENPSDGNEMEEDFERGNGVSSAAGVEEEENESVSRSVSLRILLHSTQST